MECGARTSEVQKVVAARQPLAIGERKLWPLVVLRVSGVGVQQGGLSSCGRAWFPILAKENRGVLFGYGRDRVVSSIEMQMCRKACQCQRMCKKCRSCAEGKEDPGTTRLANLVLEKVQEMWMLLGRKWRCGVGLPKVCHECYYECFFIFYVVLLSL